LTRQWKTKPSDNMPDWLNAYIRVVDVHYHREHRHWLQLQSKAGQVELYELLTEYARGHAISLQRQGYTVEATELSHEAYVSSPERLRRYPFDVTLEEWLDRHTRQCADRLVHPAGVSCYAQDLADRLPDTSLAADYMAWDGWIDLARHVEQLSGENRAVLRMWFLGFSLQETSHQLHLTEKAISNRRSRIQKWLSEGQR
jgi:DNA-directed RNA polymerase specialized sigma24 family protein